MDFAGGKTDAGMMKELSSRLGCEVAVLWTKEQGFTVTLAASSPGAAFNGAHESASKLDAALRALRARYLKPKG